MVKIIDEFSEISKNYVAIFCDLWGCLHNGKVAFREALNGLKKYRESGGFVILLTNAPRPKKAVKRHLDALSITADYYDDIVTSGDAAQEAMISGIVGRRVYHLGPERDLSFFNNLPKSKKIEKKIYRVPIEEAEGIICTGLFNDLTETPKDYTETIAYGVKKNLPLLCANPDIFVDIGHTRVWCAGGIASAYTQAGGRSLYFGKPHKPIYELAYKTLKKLRLDLDCTKILCVGDGLDTDIKGAKLEKLDSLFICGGLSNIHTGMQNAALRPNLKKLKYLLNQKEIDVKVAMGYFK